MPTARVVQILIAEAATLPMKSIAECNAFAGRGIEGDRYFQNIGTLSPNPQKPDFEITLIEQECNEHFARESALPFTALDARRNIVTEGIRLNDLVGSTFTIGEVSLQGIRRCEPCTHLARLTSPEILRGLVHKGGLRAQILRTGKIHVGDHIQCSHKNTETNSSS